MGVKYGFTMKKGSVLKKRYNVPAVVFRFVHGFVDPVESIKESVVFLKLCQTDRTCRGGQLSYMHRSTDLR